MKRQERNHFTLIELLIVISMIAVIVSLLLPALKSARERGFLISCVGMNKQTGSAVMLYSGDYQDWLPPGINFPPGYSDEIKHQQWLGLLGCATDNWGRNGKAYGVYWSCEQTSKNFFLCPGEPLKIKWSEGYRYGHIGGNAWLLGLNTAGASRMTRLLQPSQAVISMESNAKTFPLYDVWYAIDNFPVQRHVRGNVLFSDGHVGSFSRSYIESVRNESYTGLRAFLTTGFKL